MQAAQLRPKKAAAMFAALGDETRLRIVGRLCKQGPSSIVGLTEAVDVSRQAVTKHLRALERVGLVDSARDGRERIWELHPGKLDVAKAYLDVISQQWDSALGRLREFVETPER